MSKRELYTTGVKVNANHTSNLTEVKTGGQKMPPNLTEVKVEGNKEIRNGKMESRRESEFVYVNSAFVGSVYNVNENRRPSNNDRTPAVCSAPVTEVYREQYWACSRWPHTQKVITGLAIAVGVLLGALIGLIVMFTMNKEDDPWPIFTRQHIAPE